MMIMNVTANTDMPPTIIPAICPTVKPTKQENTKCQHIL